MRYEHWPADPGYGSNCAQPTKHLMPRCPCAHSWRVSLEDSTHWLLVSAVIHIFKMFIFSYKKWHGKLNLFKVKLHILVDLICINSIQKLIHKSWIFKEKAVFWNKAIQMQSFYYVGLLLPKIIELIKIVRALVQISLHAHQYIVYIIHCWHHSNVIVKYKIATREIAKNEAWHYF